MKLNRIITLLMLVIMAVSCGKKEDLASELPPIKTPDEQPLPQDIWIRDSLTIPYNIAVKYKWDALELDLYKTLVPPYESQIVPSLKIVKQVWIDTYVAQAGNDFFKSLCPKQFLLVGSANYETDGSVILGTAEAGRKVVLYNINNLTTTKPATVTKLMHVIEHEFTHILHMNVRYPTEFKTLTPVYTSTWTNFTADQANAQGFITPYAMNSSDEDFAEMVSTMVTTSKQEWDRMINGITSPTGRAALRAKENIVVNYFNDIYNIDFYALQARTVEAIQYVTSH
ncbi:zinc-binding metallopeptidase [Pinibacter soli]|uniref:Zinc-binding metallopeptidase n=1 Tax=Pinibacter soli TaxID=3044211 RepID=A0ABT6RJC4_9BACT|nr:putative zinc-binding metallopeptidase [Pinibacter soli]MDI3322676.1 putative zinc-binding metallopeptidase [Pinibacter soli]